MQEEIVSTALEGRDLLAILPTGGGKSICFQVPAMMRDGIAIVVTPLIALMKDQVQNLSSRGIRAIAVHAGMERREVSLALNNAAYGDYKFLYISPERIGTPSFREWIGRMDVNFIVVDEAHCISQWGYDFRPDYLRIGELRKLTDAPVIALTATATPEVAEDIMARLDFSEKLVLRSGFERPNLSYVVRECEDKAGQLLGVCRGVAGSGIVYMRSRKKTEEVAAFLRSQGESASFYHAGLGHAARSVRQEKWKQGEIRIMVCTNAFGMGIDKPDVRFVVHMDLPDSPEAYFQEAGRAGRDGLRSYAVALWNGTDLRRLDQIERVSFPELSFIEDVYQKVHAFFQIPYGAGEGRQLKFDLNEFCKAYKLERSPAYYAVKYIGQEGHWTYSEDVDIQTRVRIIVDRTELYDVDLPDGRMETVLDGLMRRCEGVFSWHVPVDEEYFADSVGLTVPAFRQLLYQMSIEHVISYVPQDHSDVLFLHHDRLERGNLALSPGRYASLKDCARKRKEAMISYVNSSECRQSYLLRYFGQETSDPCGTCDVCRANSRKIDICERIINFINSQNGDYTMSDMQQAFGPATENSGSEWCRALRELIDQGKVPPYKV